MAFRYTGHVMKRTTIWLSKIQIRELHALARETEETIAALIRRAIDEFMERRKAAKESGHHAESPKSSSHGEA